LVRFHGVRGSTPCHGDEIARYGGNTSCVSVDVAGEDPLLFDLGTGLRYFGLSRPTGVPFHGTCLLSHLHWDHVQGLPFFVPINRPGARLDVYGPAQDEGLSLEDAFGEFMRPPYFPVGVADLAGEFHFHGLESGDRLVGSALVRSRLVPHVGTTIGYRVELDGVSVAYIPDHQQPADGSFTIADSVLELCDGVDLLIHDSQYTEAEFAAKAHWGHCTVDYAVHVARESGAKRLALFHHDPDHDDATVDARLAAARRTAAGAAPVEVLAAYEGLTVALSAPVAASPPVTPLRPLSVASAATQLLA